MADEKTTPELQLPGFRFHPTEEELLDYYLRNRAFAKKWRVDVIGFLNIYQHAPWELPGTNMNKSPHFVLHYIQKIVAKKIFCALIQYRFG